jgi:serine O-acetyltransferase
MGRFIAMLRADIAAIFRNDPAATNIAEVLLYPGLHAIVNHRIAHSLWRLGIPVVPRVISQWSRFVTGIEIHPGATIGSGFFIDHGMGTVIGETAEIGDNVMLYQGVTLGGTGKQLGKRHPTLHDGVIVGVGASVLGAISIGCGARIGGGAVVVKDVPPFSTAIGIPARIVATRDPITGESRRVEELPDPEGDMLRDLRDRLLEIEQRFDELVEQTSSHTHHHHHSPDTLHSDVWKQLEHPDDAAPDDPDKRKDRSYDNSAL